MNTRYDEAKNYPDDALLENGNYSNMCLECKDFFIGHKRRITCRQCAEQFEWNKKFKSVCDEIEKHAASINGMAGGNFIFCNDTFIRKYRNTQKRIAWKQMSLMRKLKHARK